MPRLDRSRDAYERYSSAVDVPLVALAIIWTIVLLIPLVVRLSSGGIAILTTVDFLLWGLFVFDYLVKLYLSPSRSHFFIHHLVDLAVVAIPLLRPLRILRLLTLLRVGLVLTESLVRFRAVITHRGLHISLLVAMAIVFVGAGVELSFEAGVSGSTIQNYGDALWWAVVTVTTVGYGDRFPVSSGGRGVAVVLMLLGIGLIGVLTATVASYFVESKTNEDMAELRRRLDRIEALLITSKDAVVASEAVERATDA